MSNGIKFFNQQKSNPLKFLHKSSFLFFPSLEPNKIFLSSSTTGTALAFLSGNHEVGERR